MNGSRRLTYRSHRSTILRQREDIYIDREIGNICVAGNERNPWVDAESNRPLIGNIHHSGRQAQLTEVWNGGVGWSLGSVLLLLFEFKSGFLSNPSVRLASESEQVRPSQNKESIACQQQYLAKNIRCTTHPTNARAILPNQLVRHRLTKVPDIQYLLVG